MGERVQPTGTVTFLFTDVEDHTRLWEAFPAAMPTCLERHDGIVRAAIESHGGYVFSTAGDAFCAAFSSVGSAVSAAVEAQVGLNAATWPDECVLRVRMGLHTGEAQERDGDYFGPAVIRAARIMSSGHGGQILVSAATAALAREREFDSREVGTLRLRGMSRPEPVSQVMADGLPTEFSAVRSLEMVGNLPADRDVFVGRERDVAEVRDLIRGHRLVTLTGVGGVGKTRLATMCGRLLSEDYADGVWLVELAEVGDDDEIAVAVMTTLGLQPQGAMTPLEAVIEVVSEQQLLLVLDNCEHVLEGAAQLADGLLSRAGSAVVVATSREGLGVNGERLVPVPSLPVGPDSAATKLFADRARAAGWTPAPGDDAAVLELCRRLDGMPLAIELAAARAGSIPLDEIVERLDDRFRLLAGRRGAVERHQTLRATVAWSYESLTDDERRLFDRLSVFLGSFSISDVESVCTDNAIEAVLVAELLGSLASKSMLVLDEGGYRLLETLRQYGEEQLGTSDDPDRWRTRHLAHYVEWAQMCAEGLWGPDETDWIRRLRFAWPNLRAAVQYAIEQRNADAAATIISHVGVTGINEDNPEVGAWCDQVLALDGAEDARYSASVVAISAIRAVATGDDDTALAGAEEAKRLLDVGGSDVALAVGNALGTTYALFGRTDDAVHAYRDAADQAAVVGRSAQHAWFTSLVSFVLVLAGRTAEGLEVARSSAAMADATRNPTARAWAKYSLGLALFDRAPEEARQALEEALEFEDDVISQGVIFGSCRGNLAMLAVRDGEPEDACALTLEAVRFYRRTGSWGWLQFALAFAAGSLLASDRAETAAQLLGYLSAAGTPVQRMQRLLDRLLNDTRSVLGEARTQELMAIGARMSPPEAAGLAERDLEGQ